MALISLSDWLDRFGDRASASLSPAVLDEVHFSATEVEPPANEGPARARRSLGERLQQACRRAFWRLKRQPTGSA